MRPGIDLVVVNYRTANDLDEFCRSVSDDEPLADFSLTIVNNDPDDPDEMVAEKWLNSGMNVRVLSFENIGYARAVNAAAAIGRRECLGIFNADVVVTPGSIDACYVNLMGNDDWGVLGPRQVDHHGRITAAGIFGTNTNPKHRGWKRPDSTAFQDVRADAVTVAGSAFFVKRSVWDELTECPIFKERYPEAKGAFLPTQHFYEETWCSYHAAEHGYANVYFGVVKMVHKWHQASPVGGEYSRTHLPESQAMFREMCDLHGIERN